MVTTLQYCHGRCTYLLLGRCSNKNFSHIFEEMLFCLFHPQAFVIQWHKKTDDAVFPDGLSKEYIRSLQYLTSYMQCCLLPMHMNSYWTNTINLTILGKIAGILLRIAEQNNLHFTTSGIIFTNIHTPNMLGA